MRVALRAAMSEDASQVAEALLASRKAFLPYAPIAHTEPEVREWVGKVLVPSGGVMVACAGETLVGVLATTRREGASWIDQLYVAPSHVGQGVGTQLLKYALSALPRPVRLYTFQANTRSLSFYERHGFKVIAFTDGSANEERCPDVLYELVAPAKVEV